MWNASQLIGISFKWHFTDKGYLNIRLPRGICSQELFLWNTACYWGIQFKSIQEQFVVINVLSLNDIEHVLACWIWYQNCLKLFWINKIAPVSHLEIPVLKVGIVYCDKRANEGWKWHWFQPLPLQNSRKLKCFLPFSAIELWVKLNFKAVSHLFTVFD